MFLMYMENLARLRRFERPTPAFGGQYSIHLSYRRVGENFYCGKMSFYNKAAATSASHGSGLFCRDLLPWQETQEGLQNTFFLHLRL
jgi:hypothetical protein